MKKISLLLAICLILSMAIVMDGCSSGKKLYLYVNDDALTEAYTNLAKSFEKDYNADENNSKLQIVVKSITDDYTSGLKSALAQEKDYPSIFILNDINDYNIVKDSCADLSDMKLYSDELEVKSLAITENEKVTAIPVSVDGFGLIFNNKIMQKYFNLDERATTISSVEEITSYDILVKVVEDIHVHSNELGIKDVVAPVPLKMNYRTYIDEKLVGIPLYYELTNSSDENIKFKYSENLKNILDLFIRNTYISATLLGNITYIDTAVDFAQGESAIMMGTTSSWKYILAAENNGLTNDDITLLPLYMGIKEEKNYSIAMGTESYIAVNNKLDDESMTAAKEFVNWLYTDKECIDEFDNLLSLPFKSAKGNNPITDKVIEYAQSDAQTVPFINDLYPSRDFNSIMGEVILDYVQGIYTWDGIIATATDAWQNKT